MFYRIPEEFFFPVVKVHESNFFDNMEEEDNLKKDADEKDVFKEADDEYLKNEIG
ncbi:hypothetical protein NNC19_14385 [Clostridium sp. SHJSY1]|uniref:hypothetical protein n=1 Tax=Clostridium sp. SHJSY1 TaxID=2942483 RepID=UPI0028750281|nr:hypothetical protein [Clostridium sp. SHJSY1]MDS0526876.1 hypothetical protein [Clostridium sp. SHJSY1]